MTNYTWIKSILAANCYSLWALVYTDLAESQNREWNWQICELLQIKCSLSHSIKICEIAAKTAFVLVELRFLILFCFVSSYFMFLVIWQLSSYCIQQPLIIFQVEAISNLWQNINRGCPNSKKETFILRTRGSKSGQLTLWMVFLLETLIVA
jgi:hypothetical protein